MPDLTPYLQLGPVAIIALALMWVLTQVLKLKKNGNGHNNEMAEITGLVKKIEGNHCSDIGGKLDELIRQGQEADRKHDRVIELLIEMRSKNANNKTQ